MPPVGGVQTISAPAFLPTPREIRLGAQAVPVSNNLSGMFSAAQAVGSNFLPAGSTAQTAVSSIIYTGEPISSAILSAGNFALNSNKQKTQAKNARLAASTARDKGVTSVLGNFIAEHFDPTDSRTAQLLAKAEADANNPNSQDRGDRQYAISKEATALYADQLQLGRAYLPNDPFYLSYPRGESADAIGGTIASGIVENALNRVSEARTGKSTNDILKDKYGASYSPGILQTNDFQVLFDELFPDRKSASQDYVLSPTANTQAGTDALTPQYILTDGSQPQQKPHPNSQIFVILAIGGLILLGVKLYGKH